MKRENSICAYCGASPVFESVWVDNKGKAHNVWLCARCDDRPLYDLMDFFGADPVVPGAEFGPE